MSIRWCFSRFPLVVLAALPVTVPAVSAEPADPCQSQIPPALHSAIKRDFPAYRAPLAIDNAAADVQKDRKRGGTGCLGVASANFDGKMKDDLLLALTGSDGKSALVVLATVNGGVWEFQKFDALADGRSRLYVAAHQPGNYRRTKRLDTPLEVGEIDPLVCKNAAVVYGFVGSAAVTYCDVRHQWLHVWTE